MAVEPVVDVEDAGAGGGGLETAKDLFSGAMGDIAQVLIGESAMLTMSAARLLSGFPSSAKVSDEARGDST